MKHLVTIGKVLLNHVPEGRYQIHVFQDYHKFDHRGSLFQQNVDLLRSFHLQGKTRNKSKK